MYIPYAIGGPGTGFERPKCFDKPYKVTLLAPFSLLRLKEEMESSCLAIQSPYRVQLSPCTSPIRYVLDPETGLPGNPSGVHVLLFRFEDWNNAVQSFGSYDGVHPASRELIELNLRKMIQGLQDTAERCFGTVLLVLCPPSAKYLSSQAAMAYYGELAERLQEAVSGYPQLLVVSALDQLSQSEGSVKRRDSAERLYSDRFWQLMARKIIRVCYSAESRPWRGVILAADLDEQVDPASLRCFLKNQWSAGRQIALAGECVSGLSDGFAAIDSRPLPVTEKLRGLADALLVPTHDVMFLGRPKDCTQVVQSFPQMLSLPFLVNGAQFLPHMEELWCIDPIFEHWITEPESMRPTLPRLSARVLMNLAGHPTWSVAQAVQQIYCC